MTATELDYVLNEILQRIDALEKTVAGIDPRQINRIWSEKKYYTQKLDDEQRRKTKT